jgi:hypothetical protein
MCAHAFPLSNPANQPPSAEGAYRQFGPNEKNQLERSDRVYWLCYAINIYLFLNIKIFLFQLLARCCASKNITAYILFAATSRNPFMGAKVMGYFTTNLYIGRSASNYTRG